MIPIRFKDKQAEYGAMLVRCGIWELWHPLEWTDYVSEFDYVAQLRKAINEGSEQGWMLRGPNGTGKTMLLNLAMMELHGSGKSVYVIDFRDLVKQYTLNWRSKGILTRLMMVDYLAIDDIGKEFDSAGSKELAITALDYVIRYRFQRKKPTWITTNMLLDEMKTSYNEHIASLLKRCMVSMTIAGEDYGNKIFNKIKVSKK